jgi:hypothetical protein
MSLSDRLKAAEYDRRLAAGLPVDHLSPVAPPQARVDVSQGGAPVLDLTEPWPTADVIPLASVSDAASAATAHDRGLAPTGLVDASLAPTGVARDDELDDAHHPILRNTQVGARSRIECEQCGGPCQIDLIDAVNQTVSLSCLSCFHMFRVEARA